MDLSTTYLGLHLANPVVAGSCGLTSSLDGVCGCVEAGAGAVVLKSIFEEQIEDESAEALGSSATYGYHLEAEEYLARYGREGAVERYLELIREVKRAGVGTVDRQRALRHRWRLDRLRRSRRGRRR